MMRTTLELASSLQISPLRQREDEMRWIFSVTRIQILELTTMITCLLIMVQNYKENDLHVAESPFGKSGDVPMVTSVT
ncbi:hypothetical protein TNCV_1609101 [Trichonephila clavipes]|nr:hypothetical protein TNCV_1609101 [Trichonephila clavipes]